MQSLLNCNCLLPCLIASALFGSMIYLMLGNKKTKLIDDFIESLGEETSEYKGETVKLKLIYKDIVDKRLKIYLAGLSLGLIVGLIYITTAKNSIHRTCLFTSLVLVITYTFYMIFPKGDYMLNHLKNQDMNNKWLLVYKEMKYRHYMGLLLGASSYMIIAHLLD